MSLIAIAGGCLVALFLVNAMTIARSGDLGIDAAYYRVLGQRFLQDGTYYLPRQLAGPYDARLMSDVLYPPTALFLFVPFSLAPAPFWWIVPIAITGCVIVRWRPAWWGILTILVLLCWPRAHAAFLFGNTDMWAMAGVAAGLMWGWPAAFLLLKPVFAPLALIGIRRRSWWVCVAALTAASLLMVPLWLDYLRTIQNTRIGWEYSVGSLPLLAVPIVAWASRADRGRLGPISGAAPPAAARSGTRGR